MAKKRKRAYSGKVSTFTGRRKDYSINRFVAVAGGLVCCFLLVIVAIQFVQQLRLKCKLDEYLVMLEQAQARNEAVAEEIERLKELDYIEVRAYRLGLVKPGDIVFQLED